MAREIVDVDRFLTAPELDCPQRDVPVPELGNGAVIPVWGMTPSERMTFDNQFMLSNGKRNKRRFEQYRQRLLIQCCRNDDGVPLFSESHVAQLGKRSGVVVERLVNVAMELSGISGADMETLVGNSEETDDS